MANDWRPPETAPKDGHPFIAQMFSQIDLVSWDARDQCFRDYFYKQKIAAEWPYMVGWRPLPELAHVGDSEEESRKMNGWL